MKIAFLHMTMGLIHRGSEIAVDAIAHGLSKNHDVMLVQAGPSAQTRITTPKKYKIVRVFPLDKVPSSAPNNLLDKVLFKLHVDKESQSVVDFTNAAISKLASFQPDMIVAINGPLQIKIVKRVFPNAKIVAFGHAGIGYHDRHAIQSGPDLFIALTPQAKTWAVKLAHSSTHVEYIPNPLIHNVAKNSDQRKLNLKKPIILTVSALSEYKNVDKVIKALSMTDYSYVLIGDGEKSGAISQILSRLKNEFKWVKHVGRDEINFFYNQVDIFCFTPDPQEAFGMVYLEAMSAGLPIVASDDPIRRSLIGKEGVFVDPHDLASIASGMEQALSKKKVNYSQMLAPFEIRRVIEQIEGAFHELLK